MDERLRAFLADVEAAQAVLCSIGVFIEDDPGFFETEECRKEVMESLFVASAILKAFSVGMIEAEKEANENN